MKRPPSNRVPFGALLALGQFGRRKVSLGEHSVVTATETSRVPVRKDGRGERGLSQAGIRVPLCFKSVAPDLYRLPSKSRILGGLVAALIAVDGFSLIAADAPALPPLTTVPGSPRLPGKFVWADLVTDDVPAARKFYARMFGWTFLEVGHYTIAANDERPLCGIIQRPRPTEPGATARWLGYLSVPNVGRARDAVTRAGGRVLREPRNLPKLGEQAIFADAEGAVFGVMKSSSGDPPDFLADPGDWIWIQLLSRDGRQAAKFYRSVGGYEIVENTTPGLSDYVLASDGYARATVRTIRPGGPEMLRPTWLPFVRVRSVSESVARAKQLGGKVLIEPKPELLGRKVAVIADPAGAALGILEWSESLAKGEAIR